MYPLTVLAFRPFVSNSQDYFSRLVKGVVMTFSEDY
jgi:hypothetical protein